MHVAALGLGIASVQALGVQLDPPVAHSQAIPAFVVMTEQAANVFRA